MNKGKKRLFILLGMATVLLYCLVFAVIWLIMTSESAFWRHVFLIGLLAAFVVLMLQMG